jgi:hypothetical protein
MTRRVSPKITEDTPIGPDVDLDRENIRLPDGTRLTNELAQQIADDVRSRGGRPSLTGAASASPRVSFRLTPEVRDQAEQIAAHEGKTISQLAREALESRIKAS